jgi:Fe-S-cluster containining protein
MPVFYECQRCTACCRWPGQVRITDAEISRMAVHLCLDEHSFIQRYTRLRGDRQALVLMDKPNGECIFLEGGNCAVQPVKPQQCRDFPNLWNYPGAEQMCRAKPINVSVEEFRRRVAAATGRDEKTIPIPGQS